MLVLVSVVSVGCARSRGGAVPEPVAPPEPAPARARFHPIAPGVGLAEAELPYDDHLAEIDVLRLDLARVELEVRRLDDHLFSPLFQDPSIDVAINGGYFERDFSSSGLVLVRGLVRSPLSARGGSGVLVVRDGIASLVASDSPEASAEALGDAALALQCGPRLVEVGGAIGIARDDGRRAARTAICLRDGGRVLDLIVARRRDGLGGPSLHTLATWMVAGVLPGEPGCEAGLNLDGGPSTALYVRGAPSARRLPPGPVVDALVVRSRVIPDTSDGSPPRP